jgi:hypothetical protein
VSREGEELCCVMGGAEPQQRHVREVRCRAAAVLPAAQLLPCAPFLLHLQVSAMLPACSSSEAERLEAKLTAAAAAACQGGRAAVSREGEGAREGLWRSS